VNNSLNSNPNAAARAGAKVNLRLWSDTTSFGDVRRRVALVPQIIADKGDVKRDRKGAPLNSRFGRNYVSFEESGLNDAAEVQPCVAKILQAVAASPYADLIRTEEVEATLWIAIFSPRIRGRSERASLSKPRLSACAFLSRIMPAMTRTFRQTSGSTIERPGGGKPSRWRFS
jgi:hypothetical protein